MRFYYEFLKTARNKFSYAVPFKNIFLVDGTQIFDLTELPENAKVLYVSANDAFRGVKIAHKIKDYETSKFKSNKHKFIPEYKGRFKSFEPKFLIRRIHKTFKENVETTENQKLSNSEIVKNINSEESEYSFRNISLDEFNKENAMNAISSKYSSKADLIQYFNKSYLTYQLTNFKRNYEKKITPHIQLSDEELIDKYKHKFRKFDEGGKRTKKERIDLKMKEDLKVVNSNYMNVNSLQ